MDYLNRQPTKELQQFQKLIVQDLYIKYLNKGLDYFQWENEKKEAIIEMKDKEISDLLRKMSVQTLQHNKLEREFKEYVKKVKEVKTNSEKANKQQDLINDLKNRLSSTEERLRISHKMNQLLARQNKTGTGN